ncbi:hypothetical protein IAD21_00052 [Abditibacteriota bacterium]|nr:hypothetical protein IAD21_00052 [Abditibacteriota bacterium]
MKSLLPCEETRLTSRAKFIDDLRQAIGQNRGYAAGKLGISEKHWLYYPFLMERESEKRKNKAYEATLCFHALRQAGLFPARPEFYLRFNDIYRHHLQTLDSVGIFCDLPTMEAEIVRHYDLASRLIYFKAQEPDRSVPDAPSNCYLRFSKDKKVLLISPLSRFLKERANRETFEAVWSKTGKQWFYPRSVNFIEFLYGFSQKTQNQYETSLDLLDYLTAQIEARNFDIALIGAGGMGVPLAAFVKGKGKIGLSLGGHLQIIFGVYGEMWRNRSSWQKNHFNPSWVDLPVQYQPDRAETSENYW